jgi:hypothetical protein
MTNVILLHNEYTFRDETKNRLTTWISVKRNNDCWVSSMLDDLEAFLRRDITDLTDDISFSYNIFVWVKRKLLKSEPLSAS